MQILIKSHLPGPNAAEGETEEGELFSAFLNLTTEPHQEDLGEGAQ